MGENLPAPSRQGLEQMLAVCDYPSGPTPVPELEWALQVKAGPIGLVVGPPKGKGHVVIVAPINIDPAHLKAIRTLPPKERNAVMERIMLALLSSDTSFTAAPEKAPVFERIQISSRIFFEDLRPATLDAEVRKVRDAALKVILLVQASMKGTAPDVAIIESKLPSDADFDDWAANLLPVSADAAKRIFEMAAERGVDTATIVDELLEKAT